MFAGDDCQQISGSLSHFLDNVLDLLAEVRANRYALIVDFKATDWALLVVGSADRFLDVLTSSACVALLFVIFFVVNRQWILVFRQLNAIIRQR